MSAQRGFLDGGHNVGGQCDVTRLELEALKLGLGLKRFHLPPVETKHVRHVAQGKLGGIKREVLSTRGQQGSDRSKRFSGGIALTVGLNGRIIKTFLSGDILPGLT